MNIQAKFVTELACYSHTLNSDAFSLFMNDQSTIRVIEVDKDKLKIEIIITDEIAKAIKNNLEVHAHSLSSCFIMALNISSLGMFTWANGINHHWYFERMNIYGKRTTHLMHTQHKNPYGNKEQISEKQVRKAAIILGEIMRDQEPLFRQEYVKGIIHLGLGLGEFNFNREAFANFYRSFEHFITCRALNKKKLTNENRDITEAMQHKFPKYLVDEFQSIYAIRSEQVMHAQRKQKEIETDDVLKIKTFVDYSLHHYYLSKGNERLANWKN